MKLKAPSLVVLLLAAMVGGSQADDFAARCADRTAIERIYHSHRVGTKEPFEQVMPPAMIEQLVKQEQHKSAVLKRVYGVEITPAMLATELTRIQTTTRAAEVLAEIQRALGNDATRFSLTVVRPIIVERLLRHHFQNDDALHADERRKAGEARSLLLNGQTVEDMREVTWMLGARPAEDAPAPPASTTPTTVSARSGAYAVEATAQPAQVITSSNPTARRDKKLYFEELEPEMQRVLRTQLKKTGDVSAVIETPGGFYVFQAKETGAETLKVSSFSIPKRSYEAWLASQPYQIP